MRKTVSLAVVALLGIAGMSAGPMDGLGAATLASAKPESVGMSSKRLGLLDSILNDAVARRELPGAVVLVSRKGKIVYRKAFGQSQLVPEPRPMTPDMIFDLASVTKPVATATAVMVLVERGAIRLWDQVSQYVPEFSPWYGEKGLAGEPARLYHLLTHTSGLPPYTDAKAAGEKLGDPCATADLARLIAALPKESPAGTTFVYSCLNYITLAHIVQEASGRSLADFAAETIFKPLGMAKTFYSPAEACRNECVPTEVIGGRPLRGVVHDPLARLQGGVSGNAGLFSTADDLAVFAQMLLNGGEANGVRILSPLAVRRMTEIYPWLEASGRGLGWDIETDYSTVRGDLFGTSSYGHSGFTGTSIWIDPETGTAVIFLANSVHPDGHGEIRALRSKVANIAAAAVQAK